MSDQNLAEPIAKTAEIVSPTRLAHVVLRTSRIKEMLAWYKTVLNATVAFENDEIAFLAYDDEHHRIAFVNIPELAPQPAGMVGVHHIAFTYATLDELLGNYEKLRDVGIVPKWCVNHGPTTSMYYGDVDDNQVELQVDNYATVEAAGAYFYTDDFASNTIGVDFDPEVLIARVRSGEDQTAIKLRPPSGPRGVDTIPIR